MPGAARAVAALNAAGLPVILATNQRWLSERRPNLSSYAAVHERLEHLLAREGAWLDAAYHCPHPPGVCDCRKPAPGMLWRAAREHGLDLSRTVLAGDSDADVAAGRAAGTATILIRGAGDASADADAVVRDLDAAVRLILHAAVHPGRPREPLRGRPGQQCDGERQIVPQVPAS